MKIKSKRGTITIPNLQDTADLLLVKEMLESPPTSKEKQAAKGRKLELVDVKYVYECVAGKQYLVQIKTYCCPIRHTTRRKATGRKC